MSELHSARIAALRRLMAERNWDAVIITGTDPHCSEYPAARWKQVEWLSGFTGEAGDIVVTADHAGLWTDTRYFIQALEQLQGSGVVLHKMKVPGAVGIPEWLAGKFPDGAVIAVDGLCQSYEAVGDLPGRVVDVPDLPSLLWEGRPDIPCTPVTTLGEEQVGVSRADKLRRLRKYLLRNGCDSIFLSSLDEIAWLLNVRASDIEYNPYVISFLAVSQDSVDWFVRKDIPGLQEDSDTVDSFEDIAADDVQIRGYGEWQELLASRYTEGERIFLDPSTLNWSVGRCIADIYGEDGLQFGESPVRLWKAVKNDVEIASLREACFEDGVAMEKFLYWLEREASCRCVTEWEASERLSSLRAEIPGYRGDSFGNISACGANAALPHYLTPRVGSAELPRRGLYLVDSGGQYIFGTTDITRTVPLGPCSRLEMEDYTLVLKGMVGLAMAVFPEGTAGCQIDAAARMPLWRTLRNFGHGTGHGIGFYLGVHEGPQDIRQNFNRQPLLPGMVLSDEPGLYREGLHGIRHENMILCRREGESEFGSFLSFETLTLCHIDTAPLLRELLSDEEAGWLNAYNEKVYTTLGPALNAEQREWLRKKTLAI